MKKGLTLVEIVVTMVIVILLCSILINAPGYYEKRNKDSRTWSEKLKFPIEIYANTPRGFNDLTYFADSYERDGNNFVLFRNGNKYLEISIPIGSVVTIKHKVRNKYGAYEEAK